jgi:peptide/nickel transport system permease protein
MRAIRAQALSLKERDYVESARALDLGTPHIVFREIAPNMAGYIAINFTLAITASMYAVVALTLLGLVPLSENNWGVMINLAWTRGAIFSKDSVFYIMSPIAAIALFQLGLVAMNRSLTEVFDPRLRRGS